MKEFVWKSMETMLAKKGLCLSRLPRDPVVNYGLLSRLFYFKELFQTIKDVEGDIVECGVGSGASLFWLCKLLYDENSKSSRDLWGFDSFEGFPLSSEEDKSSRKVSKGFQSGRAWARNPQRLHEAFLEKFGGRELNFKLRLVPGFFEESISGEALSELSKKKIAFLHLDVDLYNSYKVTLERLWPCVAKGGVVLFDEYKADEKKFPGSVKAIDDFLKEKTSEIKYNEKANRYYIYKS